MIVFEWAQPAPPLTLEWVGPDAKTTAAQAAHGVSAIAAVIGPQGSTLPATDDSYFHTQGSAANVWTVTHNLGFRPDVAVTDTGGSVVVGAVAHTSLNELQITFSAAFAGFANLH